MDLDAVAMLNKKLLEDEKNEDMNKTVITTSYTKNKTKKHTIHDNNNNNRIKSKVVKIKSYTTLKEEPKRYQQPPRID